MVKRTGWSCATAAFFLLCSRTRLFLTRQSMRLHMFHAYSLSVHAERNPARVSEEQRARSQLALERTPPPSHIVVSINDDGSEGSKASVTLEELSPTTMLVLNSAMVQSCTNCGWLACRGVACCQCLNLQPAPYLHLPVVANSRHFSCDPPRGSGERSRGRFL